jgi:uncharacterized membrane protein
LAAASGSWVALLLSSPLAPAPLAVAAYATGGFICHQLAERSFHIEGHQLAVCARCSGIYVGTAMAFAWQAFRLRPAGKVTARAPLRVADARTWLLLGALPTVATVVMETWGLWATSNIERAVAGLPLGAGVAIVVGVSATVNYEQWRQRRHE